MANFDNILPFRAYLNYFACLIYVGFSAVTITAQEQPMVKKSKPGFFKSSVYANSYITTESIPTQKNSWLESYTYAHNNVGAFVPIASRSKMLKDSVSVSNLHFVLLANMLQARLSFTGTTLNNNLDFYRMSLGGRLIYSRKKNTLLITASPFVAHDNTTFANPTLRWAGSFIFSKNVSSKFSFRIGLNRTYLFGAPNPIFVNGNIPLPVIGIRYGALDGVYISLTFPRLYAIHFPMGNRVWGQVFSKPNGAIFSFNNKDNALALPGQEIIFGRRDWLSGINIMYKPHVNWALALSTGYATNRFVYFDEKANFNSDNQSLQKANFKSVLFLEASVSFRLGKAKSAYNNQFMYDMFELNNQIDPGDLNSNINTGDIPSKPNSGKIEKLQKIQINDIKELILEEL